MVTISQNSNPKLGYLLYVCRFVLGNELFLCGQHIYTHYRECKELGSYICGDRIVDIIAFKPNNVSCLMIKQKKEL